MHKQFNVVCTQNKNKKYFTIANDPMVEWPKIFFKSFEEVERKNSTIKILGKFSIKKGLQQPHKLLRND